MRCFVTSMLLFPLLLSAQTVLQKGMEINSSVTITKNTYHLVAGSSLQKPAIIISGNDIVVDFNHAVLQGSQNITEPNSFKGLAVYIKPGSKNIVLKNMIIHGYKVAVMADSVTNLIIENSDLSYNYRQHLHSNYEREDISDWMSYHHNENNEWLRYGAGIYLKNCSHALIKNNIITNGQCALMMMRCSNSEVYNNNFSFNSGIGIGLYRSSSNKIYNNTLCFNVRGFSFGKYYRGQDSAGILVFEQSSDNVFAYNNVTHSGDGFFLWAGQHTMDTGEGGCNNNLLYGNDFSYAPTNGVEVTFSTNTITKNIIKGCDNGIWGGYSFNTHILKNEIDSNKTGIAIEHGQRINISENNFMLNATAIKLWSREKQPADWKYAQARDTRSVNYIISKNSFIKNNVANNISGTDSIYVFANDEKGSGKYFQLGERVNHLDTIAKSNDDNNEIDNRIFKGIPVKQLSDKSYGSREAMRITDYGPYNFEYPLLWLKEIDSSNIYHFEVLAKTGSWQLKSVKGFKILKQGANHFPSTIVAKPDPRITEKFITLQYKGHAFTDAFGKLHQPAEVYNFSYHNFQPASLWDIKFYSWNGNDGLNNFESFKKVYEQNPVYTTAAKKVDYTWWNKPNNQLPADSFATKATSVMDLPEADYIIGITADDYAKVFIDDKPIIDAWNDKYEQLDEDTHHETTVHLKGKHSFKILHAENTGLATLMFYINPKARN